MPSASCSHRSRFILRQPTRPSNKRYGPEREVLAPIPLSVGKRKRGLGEQTGLDNA